MKEFVVAVIGGGSWGTTVAHLLASNTKVVLWARDQQTVRDINDHHQNRRYLPGYLLDPKLSATADMAAAVSQADLVVVGVPTGAVRAVCTAMADNIPPGVPVISLAKGFEAESDLRMTEVIGQELADHPVGLLTGPNLCKEIMAGQPASAVVAMTNRRLALRVQRLITTPAFPVFTNSDVVGCELGGVHKNVYVIAVGVVEGCRLGDNARAAVMTRGLAELTGLATKMGAEPLTIAGLAGMGDLVTSCISSQSRNARVGRELGAGKTMKQILSGLDQVAEGVAAAKSVHKLAQRYDVKMPIAQQVYSVCWRNGTPKEAVEVLLRDQPRAENNLFFGGSHSSVR